MVTISLAGTVAGGTTGVTPNFKYSQTPNYENVDYSAKPYYSSDSFASLCSPTTDKPRELPKKAK